MSFAARSHTRLLLALAAGLLAAAVAPWGAGQALAATSLQPYRVTLGLSAGQIAPGDTVTFAGHVTIAGGGPAPGTVVVQKRRDGGDWSDWRGAVVGRDGSYAVAVALTAPDRVWEFRAMMPRGLDGLTGYSAVRTLTVGARAAAASSWSEATLFNIGGRGWGHGIGMSQYGAYGYAKHGWGYKKILRHYYTGIRFGKTGNRTVRVLLASKQDTVRVSSGGAFTATDGHGSVSLPAATVVTLDWSGGAYRVTAGDRSWTFAQAVTFKRGSHLLRLYNRNQNGWPKGTGGARYRGTLVAVRAGSGFEIVNHVRLEGYLRGVVPRESPSSWPQAALRAQAVAARSYAVRGIKSGGTYDLRCTTASQVYNGYDGEAASTDAAVAATAGVVPTYGGQPIVAYFFSTSGGRTEDIQNVWGGNPVPYLKSVADPYDTYSPYHIWPGAPYRYSGATVAGKLGSLVPGTLRAVYVTKRGKSPRVVSAVVLGQQDGAAQLTSGWALHSALGLRDTWFWIRSMSVSPSADDHATITYGQKLTLQGRTYPATIRGKRVILDYYRDGTWRTSTVSAARTVKQSFTYTAGDVSGTGSYTAYSFIAKPGRTTRYYFSYGKSRSPVMTVGVRPALTIDVDASTASAGDTVTFSGAVRPLTKVGDTVELRRLSDGAWLPVGQGTVAADGSYQIPWTAESGTWTFEVRIAAGDQLLANSSSEVTVTVP